MKKFKFFASIGLILLMAFPVYATVSSEVTRVKYTCNGTTTVYAYPFKVYEDDDLLAVKALTSTGAETTLVLNTDYTVSGAGGAGGGNLTLTAGSKCGSGCTLTILRNLELTQETDYVDGQAFSAESLESAIDKVMLIQQQQAEQIGRAPKLPKTSSITDIALPNPVANNLIGWNAAGTTLINRTDGITLTTATGYEVDALVTYGGGTAFTQATIEAALTAIGTSNKVTLLIRPGTWPIISNADWSAYTNVTFKIVPGAVISHGAFTVNVPNPDAGLYQAFSGTGKVTLTGGPGIIPVEWFGATTTASNNATAINKAIETGKASGKAVLLTGIYPTTATVYLTQAVGDDGVELRGINRDISGISYTGTNAAISTNSAGSITSKADWKLRNLKIVGNNSAAYGVYVNYSPNGEISDCIISNFAKHGIFINTNNWTQRIENNRIHECGDAGTYGGIYIAEHNNNSIQIDKNVIFGINRKRWGIYVSFGVAPGSFSVTVTNNLIENTVDAVSGGQTVIGNYIEGVTNSCIIAGGVSQISGNFLNPTGYASTGNYGITVSTKGNFISANNITTAALYNINNTGGYANYINVSDEGGTSNFKTIPWPSNTVVYQTLNAQWTLGSYGKAILTKTVPTDVVAGTLTLPTNLGSKIIVDVIDNSNFNLSIAGIPSGGEIVIGIYNHSGVVMGTIFFVGIAQSGYIKPANGKIVYATFDSSYRQITPWTPDITY